MHDLCPGGAVMRKPVNLCISIAVDVAGDELTER